MSRRVVVTGMGAVTPLGLGADALHSRAVTGSAGLVDGVGRCEFDLGAVLSRREARRMDRFCQFAAVAGDEAVAQAGWSQGPPCPRDRVTVVIGSAIGGLGTLETQLDNFTRAGADRVATLTVPMLMVNAGAAQLSMRYGLHGEATAPAVACSSGAQAICAGARAIRAGEADAAVVGGAEASTGPFTAAMFAAAGALSATGRSVPFHRDRDGFLLGEGAGVLILEAAEVAEARGAPILAELAGYGTRTDAHHLTAPDPTGAVMARAVRVALADGGIGPAEVAYINAHGTGTQINDRVEVTAMRSALGTGLAAIPISSTKSVVGHLLGAAGAVESIATIQALRHRTAPPTAGLTVPDPELGDLTHVRAARPLTSVGAECVGLSNSMGFGGHNVAIAWRA
ncbi:beta-ketoacyl-[acyl-carrier-protein] synthase family protein [Nocardia sp. NPDC059177]|uniref:beta-ketoacyl-[acyl-carrier-protein] synthase family protein n=1 Tax=Nocardia sp. NPDC059177 TaxID=3346759 RepID=UPI0036BF70E6